MEDSDRKDHSRQILLGQSKFKVVKKLTRSVVSRYGNLGFENSTLSEFQGPGLAVQGYLKGATELVDTEDVP